MHDLIKQIEELQIRVSKLESKKITTNGDSILNRGKYKGMKVSDVYEKYPAYCKFVLINSTHDDFKNCRRYTVEKMMNE